MDKKMELWESMWIKEYEKEQGSEKKWEIQVKNIGKQLAYDII